MKSKIVIAGGTGFVGTYLRDKFLQAGCEVVIISRDKAHVSWNDRSALQAALNNASMVINLAGKTINCRFNEENRKQILSSRIKTTKALGEAISECTNAPLLWLNASTAILYTDHAHPNTEDDSTEGRGFPAQVTRAWEAAFNAFDLLSTRRVAIRITIVLGKDGGVMPIYKTLVKFMLGGRQGTGSQIFSWIHIEDFHRMILFIQANTAISGPVNFGSPLPIKNEELMEAFREAMHVEIGLPAPVPMIEMGATLIGTEPELVLNPQWVIPEKLMNAGFQFRYASIQEALKNLLES